MQIVIMRGVSGSGKSTKARELVEEFLESNPDSTTITCSADDFFLSSDGVYGFDPHKLGQAHAWCKGQVVAAMKLGADLVVVDNTNTQKWEFQSYLDLAQEHGYEVQECKVGGLSDDDLLLYAERNSHGVPLDAIKRMAQRFEQ